MVFAPLIQPKLSNSSSPCKIEALFEKLARARIESQLSEVEDGIRYVIPNILDKAAVKLGYRSD